MTDLLTAAGARLSRPGDSRAPRRPLALGAAVAGATAAVGVLVACMAVGLAGWFASDAGAHGTTRDALRVGADAWLLALGAHLDLAGATISMVPLGLTLVSGYVAYRLGRWAALGSAVTPEDDDTWTVLLGALVLAAVYAVVAVLTAVLASGEAAQPHLGMALFGGFMVGLLGGGLGIAAGSGFVRLWWSRWPGAARAVIVGALSAVLLLLAAAALLLAVALLLHLGSAANVLSRLHTDTAGAVLYTILVAGVAPNAVLLTGGYLLGPGFAVGTGTVVSPSAVVLGPVPAFPLLAALPGGGVTPWWTTPLVAVPVLAAGVAAALAVRRFPVPGYDAGALRGLGAGVVGGLVAGLLVALAGGSVGPGRMADVGATVSQTCVAAVVAMGVGGLVGGVAMSWWQRRRPATS
jgi:hypothetical protein